MPTSPALNMRTILRTWWPLAASWVLMGAELPALSAVLARLPAPEVHLAAYGGVVYSLALIIEAPIIMLLAASTALSKDWRAYVKIRRVMMVAGAGLTALHLVLACSPLYYVVVKQVLGVPAEIVEPARLGLVIMTPWTWSIAYRRFNQGVLIRFGHARVVGLGTVVRLTVDGMVLAAGYLAGTIPGVAVGSGAVAAGVVSEALYTGLRVKPVLRYQLRPAVANGPPLTYRAFFAFYIPLVLTAFLSLVAQPTISAALSRMPGALPSLATWPVLSGLIFVLRGLGIAYNEVVVALLDEPVASRALARFTIALATLTALTMAVVAGTPLAGFWFGVVSALPARLAELAQVGLWLALSLPSLSVLQSWYQGLILHSRHTRGVSEAVVIYLLSMSGVLFAGVAWGGMPGLYVAVAAMVLSSLAQVGWLWYRSRPAWQVVRARDAASPLSGSPSPVASFDPPRAS